jgi:hypothetical protein
MCSRRAEPRDRRSNLRFRTTSTFVHYEDITSVSPLAVEERRWEGSVAPTQGGDRCLSRRPGLTQQCLHRVVDCHSAHTAVLGDASMPDCPRCEGRHRHRSQHGRWVAVRVSAPDIKSAETVYARARMLVPL